jgi:LysM domain-containing protein
LTCPGGRLAGLLPQARAPRHTVAVVGEERRAGDAGEGEQGRRGPARGWAHHRGQAGDTLSRIAAANGVASWESVREANPGLDNPSHFSVGARIALP